MEDSARGTRPHRVRVTSAPRREAMANGFFDNLIHAVNGTARTASPRRFHAGEIGRCAPHLIGKTAPSPQATPHHLTDGAAAIWVANEEGLKNSRRKRPA